MSSIVRDPAEDLLSLLRSTAIFKPLREPELADLAARMTIRDVSEGAVLVRQNDVFDELVLPMNGTLRATMTDRRENEREIAVVTPGDTTGEMNLFSPLPALASLSADGPARIASLSRSAFEAFCEACPAGALHVIEAMRPRLRRQRLATALHRSEMFRDVHPDALVALESEFELIPLYGGEVLFKQGDVGDSLYVVMSGRLRVAAAAADGERVLAELGAGETVGEMAVLSGEPRSATVYAVRDTQLARLTTAAVKQVIERHPHAMMDMLTGRLVERVRTLSRGERKRSEVVTIGVVAAADGHQLSDFCASLATALSRMGSVAQLRSAVVDRHLGRAGVAQAHDRDGGGTGLVEWLAQQEAAHRFVVYEADARLTPWTERCVRQADRLVVVAPADADHAPGEIEAELLAHDAGRRTPVTLVLLHADGRTPPTGTARWLHGRTLERHLHVRRDRATDFERLARFLTGNALGIALGGGFARGLAHLGVLRAMDELGIPVDAVGGASMGAMVGAQWACGSGAPQIVHEMRTGFAESFDDMTLPFLAFKRGGKASGFVRRLFGETRIEDLWVPFFCVSANLNRAELKIHTAGRLADAVLASSRAPGIFPPMVIDGELHVDGGLINNVPVDVMKRFVGDGLVIGVDVSPPHELNHVHDYGEDVPGWRAAWLRFNPARDRRIYHPSILLVLMRVIEFGGISYRREKAELADLYISPSVLRFKRNDFGLADEIATSGYDAARERLREWLASASAAAKRQRPDLFGPA